MDILEIVTGNFQNIHGVAHFVETGGEHHVDFRVLLVVAVDLRLELAVPLLLHADALLEVLDVFGLDLFDAEQLLFVGPEVRVLDDVTAFAFFVDVGQRHGGRLVLLVEPAVVRDG